MRVFNSTLPISRTDALYSEALSSDSVPTVRSYDVRNARTDGQSKSKPATLGGLRKVVPPHIEHVRGREEWINSIPMQIWEGVVTSVDYQAQTMEAILEGKIVTMPRHSASFSLEWVHAQDYSLVMPGAVFYLTLYKQSDRSTVKNSQDIRFRRMPSWSKNQLLQIQEEAKLFASNIVG